MRERRYSSDEQTPTLARPLLYLVAEREQSRDLGPRNSLRLDGPRLRNSRLADTTCVLAIATHVCFALISHAAATFIRKLFGVWGIAFDGRSPKRSHGSSKRQFEIQVRRVRLCSVSTDV